MFVTCNVLALTRRYRNVHVEAKKVFRFLPASYLYWVSLAVYQLKFPRHIVKTSLWPDMIIISDASKHLIMLELTVPW